MTKDREFKDRVRDRMTKTGESYATARSQLDERRSSTGPRVTGVTPVLRIRNWTVSRAHYVDWLGFAVAWEWRKSPHSSSAVIALTRDGCDVMLVEGDEPVGGSWVNFKVDDIYALAEQWNDRTPGSARVVANGEPYDIATVRTVDPDGNEIHWEEPVSAAEQRARDERAVEMRRIVQERLDAGRPLPTAQDLVDQVGRPIGVAYAVLNEFPEYEVATRPSAQAPFG
jgi:hypothetical protein